MELGRYGNPADCFINRIAFGGKKIPELMKGLGKGMKSFKQGVAEAEAEIKKTKEDIDKPVETKKPTTDNEQKKEE